MATSPQGQQRRRRLPWVRVIVGSIALLLLVVGTIIWLLNIEHVLQGDWSNILPPILAVLGLGLALCQWLFPLSPVELEQPVMLTSLQTVSTQASAATGVQIVSTSQVVTSTNSTVVPQMKQPSGGDERMVFLFNEPLTDPDEFFGRVREKTTLISRTRRGASTSLVG